MDFNINDFGSVNDALQSYRTDIFDTLSNISSVADVLADVMMNIENPNYTIDSSKFPINLVYNESNITLEYWSGEGVHVLDGLGNDKGLLFDEENHEIKEVVGYNAFDLFNSVNESYTSNEILLEACDLALIHDTADADIASMMATKYGALSGGLSSTAKSTIDNIITYLQHSDVGPTGVASYISELYSLINDTLVNGEGQYYTTSNRPWYIQGFVGSYAVRTIARTSAAAITAVLTIVKPLVGIALQLLVGAFGKLKQLVLDYTSAQVKVEPLATNNMLDMSLFDLDIATTNMPDFVYAYFILHPGVNSVSFRMAGSTWIFTRSMNSKFHLQIMCNVEYTGGYINPPGITIDYTYYKTSDQSVVNWFESHGIATNLYNEVNNDESLSSIGVYDAQARTSVMTNYSTIFGLLATLKLGVNVTTAYTSGMPSSYQDNNVADHAAYCQLHRDSSTNNWSDIVSYRNSLRSNTTELGISLCQLFNALYDDELVSGDKNYIACNISFPHVSKFYMQVPGYTVGAVWGTLITLGVVSTIALTAVAGFFAVKYKVRKFMARKQLDIEAKRYAYEGDPTDAKFEDYWQSMKSYNKWATLLRYDKMDLATGCLAAANESDTSGGYGENALKKVYTNDGVKTLTLSDIYYLITKPTP